MSHLKNGADAPPQRHDHAPVPAPEASHGQPAGAELNLLREQNAALRTKNREFEQLLAKASQDAEERWAELQREYESLIEEKSEMIRKLYHKNTELRERAAHVPVPCDPGAAVELADRQELLRIQRDLVEKQRQMEQDEESMMGQMRQMEMALARDRAELSRQRNELQRLHGELKHELETAGRDSGLRQRLSGLQRRVTTVAAPHPPVNQDTPPPIQLPKPAVTTTANQNKSGLFRRIFGAGKQ